MVLTKHIKIENKSETQVIKKTQKNIYKCKKKNTLNFTIGIQEFKKYMEESNYCSAIDHSTRVKYFTKVLYKELGYPEKTEDYKIKPIHIEIFEKHLQEKINKGSISVPTSYVYLLSIRHFCEFLSIRKVINFVYTIPQHFRSNAKRSNEYVEVEAILKLINSVNSRDNAIKFRNISIILLILETGCRPIEVCNINISDLNFSERTIILRSVKSGQRKLLLNKELIKILKLYLSTRELYHPSSNSFFLRINGLRISRKSITNMFHQESIRAFGYKYISAKALRHTYATNAIDSGTHIEDLSNSMGHKHWISTYYYVNKNVNRLLKNTLIYNPFIMSGADENANKNPK
ncbi:site-specific integrase [Bacillus sp. N1-1]|uniref:tyrosine-type recombinase/integrase n=1 Tax=Bacillus sp. N1-1 TaxID=2682541 RepID=UPI001317235C|nr:site-specific integrase [Bacillus sp. N1-1]QHA93123.1 tyrosine-type recombinase/integrase [Bacillus sp. N1-1]